MLVVNNMERINQVGLLNKINFNYGNPPGDANEKYWNIDKTKLYTFTSKGMPYDAVIKGLEDSATQGECNTATQAAVLIAAGKVLGPGRFNKLYKNGVTISLSLFHTASAEAKHEYRVPRVAQILKQISQLNNALTAAYKAAKTDAQMKEAVKLYQNTVPKVAKLTQEWYGIIRNPSRWLPGDCMSFSNSQYYHNIIPGGAWSNENVIYLGKDAKGIPRFSGLGVDDASVPELKQTMIEHLEIDPKALNAFLAKLAASPSIVAEAKKLGKMPADVANALYQASKNNINVVGLMRVKTGE